MKDARTISRTEIESLEDDGGYVAEARRIALDPGASDRLAIWARTVCAAAWNARQEDPR